MKCIGPRHWRDDEEPETSWLPFDEWLDLVEGLCAYCGHQGHNKTKCPHKPLPAARRAVS